MGKYVRLKFAARFVILGCLLNLTILVVFLQKLQPNEELKEWPPESSRNVSHFLSFDLNSALLKPRSLSSCQERGLVWIFVISSPENLHKREIVRRSWTQLQYSDFRTIHRGLEGSYIDVEAGLTGFQYTFLVGKTRNETLQRLLERESAVFGDLLQENVVDHYQNLTLKSLYLLKWADSPCVKKYKFVMKIDDNTFVNVPNLVHVLSGGTLPLFGALKFYYDLFSIEATNPRNQLKNSDRLMMGDLTSLSFPYRNSRHKYFCPDYMFPGALFPPYLQGFAYVMSQQVASELLRTSLQVPLINMEDAYVTGILPDRARVRRSFSHLFAFKKLGDRCGLKGVVAEDRRDPEEFPDVVDFLLTGSSECETLNERFLKHLYKLVFYLGEPWFYLYRQTLFRM